MTLSRRDFLAALPAAATLGAPALDRSVSAYSGRLQEEQAAAPREKRLLATRCPPDLVRRHLLPMREWKPFDVPDSGRFAVRLQAN
jgi:hypothetical protein